MNAFNTINLAGAVVVTSTEVARSLGVSESKWVYPLGGAGSSDADQCEFLLSLPCFLLFYCLGDVCALCACLWEWSFADKSAKCTVWERPNFYSAPAIEQSIDKGLEMSGLSKTDIDLYDFYS